MFTNSAGASTSVGLAGTSSVLTIYDEIEDHARLVVLHYHGAGPLRTKSWYGQCAEWNADIVDAATTYELIVDKYLVLCVGVVVPVQETRPRQRSR